MRDGSGSFGRGGDGSFVIVRGFVDPPIPSRREWGSSIIHIVLVFSLSVTLHGPSDALTSFSFLFHASPLDFDVLYHYSPITTSTVI